MLLAQMDTIESQMKKIIADILSRCPNVNIDDDFVSQHIIEAMKATYGNDLVKCSFIEIKNITALCYKMFCFGRIIQNKLNEK